MYLLRILRVLCILRVLYLINQDGCLNLPTLVNLLTEANAEPVDRLRLTEVDRRLNRLRHPFQNASQKIVVVS